MRLCRVAHLFVPVIAIACGKTLDEPDVPAPSTGEDAGALPVVAASPLDAAAGATKDTGPAFGDGGVVLTAMTLRHSDDTPLALFADDAGRTFVVAQNRANDQDGVIAARLDESGALDDTYGVGGVAWSDALGPTRVRRQPDGKLVLLNAKNVVRVDDSLRLDSSFVFPSAAASDLASTSDAVVQPDRKLLTLSVTGSSVRVHRFLESGAVDTTFDGDGLAEWSSSSTAYAETGTIGVDPASGRVIVAARVSGTANVVAWNADGSLDTTFGSSGVRPLVPTTPTAIRIEADGSAYVAAMRTSNPSNVASLFHVFADGSLDAPFDTQSNDQGGVGFYFAGFDRTTDGKWIVATDFSLTRLTAAGAPDPTFGVDGRVTVYHPGKYPPDPTLWTPPHVDALGRSTIVRRVLGDLPSEVARYDATGNLDGAFGTRGVVELPFFATSESVTGLVVTKDDRLLAVGNTASAKYTMTGVLEPTFGTHGTIASGVLGGAALLPGGDVVVAGMRIERWASTGVSEPSFQPDYPIATATNNYLTALSVAVDSQSRVVLAGFGRGSRLAHPAVARLLDTGKSDDAFGTDGAYDGPEEGGVLTDLALQPDDATVAVGSFPVGARHDLGLMRLDPDGLRETLGVGDTALVDATPLDVEIARAVAIDTDGSYVVAGIAVASWDAGFESLDQQEELPFFADARLVLLRMAPDGSLVESFGQSGIVSGSEWNGFDARDVLLASDGFIYVAGRFLGDPRGRGGFAVVRFSRDGQLDAQFGEHGVLAPFAEPSAARALVEAPSGAVFAGGYVARSPTGRDFAIVKVR